MSTHSRTVFSDRLFRPAFFAAAVVLLIYGAFGALDLFDAWANSRNQRQERLLRLDLDRAITSRFSGFKLIDTQWRLLDSLQTGFADIRLYKRFLAGFESDFDGKFRFYLFQNGRNTVTYPATASNSALVAGLLAAMKAPAAQRAKLAPHLDPLATRLWGGEATVENLRKNNGGYILLKSASGMGLGHFVTYGSGLSAALLAEDLPGNSWKRFLRHRSEHAALAKQVGQGIPDIDMWVPPSGRSVRSMRLAWEQFRSGQQNTVVLDGCMWMFERDRTGTVTAIAKSVPPSRDIAALKFFTILFSILLPLACRHCLADGGRLGFISLRAQMQLLFIAATLLPMLSTLGIGWMGLNDQAERLRNAAFATGMNKLHTVNAGVSRNLASFGVVFRKLWKCANTVPFDAEKFRKMFEPFGENKLCHHLLILDSRNRVYLREIDADRDDVIDIVTMLSRSLIRRFIPGRIAFEDQDKVLPIDLITEQISANAELGWASLVETPRVPHRLQIGFTPSDIIWDVFPDLATGPALMVGMTESEDLMQSHLIRSISMKSDSIRLFLLDGPDLEMRPEPGADDLKILSPLMQVSNLTGKVVQREITLSSGTAWVVTFPESVVGKFVMAAVLDADKELSRLNNTKLALLLGLLASFLTAFAAGHLLSAFVLVPIADLQSGVDAIRRRRADVVIPLRRDDEFGHLAKIFNHALGELKELELARVVQTSLLPAAIPEIDGYSLAAVNIPATDLSGDYYDLIPCSDGSLLMLIGDVTGHGASAALAMAMAKATVAYRLADGQTRPTPLMTSLNDVFYQELRSQRKYMTMLMVRLDPGSHHLTIESSGHNYPLLHSFAAGKTEYLEMVGIPLGVRRKPSRDTIDIDLAPGDAFVMYTDGYTECLLPTGEQLGDEALRTFTHRLAREGKAARDLLDGLLIDLNIRRVQGPLADDVTLVVLRRNR